jgi:hypothetical protein
VPPPPKNANNESTIEPKITFAIKLSNYI